MHDYCTQGWLLQEAGPSGRVQRGPAPTRRALFAGHLQGGAGDWAVTASRNVDAPEMGSPRSSDEGDNSSSGSSQVKIPRPVLAYLCSPLPMCLFMIASCVSV